jgi:alanine racemase
MRIASVRAIVHLDRLATNLAAARSLLPPGTKVYGVVKANAYGHGALPVARALERCGIDGLTVDSLDEGEALRQGAIATPVLVLAPLLPDQVEAAVEYRLTATIAAPAVAMALDAAARAAARAAGHRLAVHVRLKSGPAGLGVDDEGAGALLESLHRLEHLAVEGLYVQMTGTYRDDHQQIAAELARFARVIDDITARGLRPPLVHAVTSPGLLNAPDLRDPRGAAFDMVRLGSVLYGIRMNPPGDSDDFPFQPVMEVVSRVGFITDLAPGSDIGYGGTARLDQARRVAMIPMGYADMPCLHHPPVSAPVSARANPGSGQHDAPAVLIRGQRMPLIGEASMGMVLADVTDMPGLELGESVVVVGRQGNETIAVEAIAGHSGVRPSAVLMLGPRVVRSYTGELPRDRRRP